VYEYQEEETVFFSRRLTSFRAFMRVPVIRWLVVSHFFANLFFYSTTIVLFQQQRGLNYTEIFLLETVLSGAILLAELPSSILADRFGHRFMIILGYALALIDMPLFLFAHHFWMFVLADAISGLSLACISGCDSALLYNELPPETREKDGNTAFALLRGAGSAGFFLGLFGGSFFGAYSPTLAVAVSIIPSALAFVASLGLLGSRSRVPRETSLPAWRIVRDTWLLIRSQPGLVALGIWQALAFGLINAIFWYDQPYLLRVHVPVFLFGPIMAAAVGLQTFFISHTATLQKRLGTPLLLVFSGVVSGCCYLVLALVTAAPATILAVAGVVAFSAWQQPVIENELNRRLEDTGRATALSTVSLIASVAGMALNAGVGRLGDLGMEITGLALGLSLIVLGLMIPLLVRR